jgi:hypothetical protein
MTRGRRLLIGVGGMALVILGTAAYVSLSSYGDANAHPFNQDRNAVWIEHRWLEHEIAPGEIEALLDNLGRRGIQYVFPHVIPFDRDGRLPAHSREQMRAFLRVAHARSKAMKVLPWVGGLRVGYRRTRRGTIDLDDLGQRQRIIAECRGLIDEGFDGIHLNIEPVPNGDDAFLALLRALRPAVGDDKLLSLSAIRPSPFGVPIAPNFFWSTDYYARVAGAVDQLVVMGYDTGLPTSALYRRYMSYTADAATGTLKSHSRARVLLGVPTYDGTGLMHRGDVETLENALLGIVAGLRGSGAGGTIEGVALYAYWTTDDDEWRTYERLWRGGAGPAQ